MKNKILSISIALVFMWACTDSNNKSAVPIGSLEVTVDFSATVTNVVRGGEIVLKATASGGINEEVTFVTKSITPESAKSDITYEKISGTSAKLKVASSSNATKVVVMAISVEDETENKTVEFTIIPATVFITSKGPATIGEDFPLTAKINGKNSTALTWSIESNPIPDGVTLNNNILKTTISSTAKKVKVKAVSNIDNTKFDTSDIVITSISTITITSNDLATKGIDYDLVATVIPVNGVTPTPDTTVTWILFSTTPPNDASVSIVNGKLRTTSETSATSVKVIVMSNAENSVIKNKDIAINSTITSVSITSKGPITQGTDYNLEATIVPVADITPTPNLTVIWELVSPKSTQDPTVTIENGKLLTTSATTVSSATIKAISYADKTISETVEVAINFPTTSLSITSRGPATKGIDYILTASINNIASTAINWSIQQTNLSGVLILDNKLLQTSLDSKHNSVKVKAVSNADETQFAVIDIAISSITLVKISSTEPILKGTDYTLSATVDVVDEATPAPESFVTWTLVSTTPANDTTITITNGKLITTPLTIAKFVTVKATSTEDSTRSDMKDIFIDSTISSTTITSTGPVTKGTDYTLTATVVPVEGITPPPDTNVIWKVISTIPANDKTVSIADGVLKTTTATTATSVKIIAISIIDNTINHSINININ